MFTSFLLRNSLNFFVSMAAMNNTQTHIIPSKARIYFGDKNTFQGGFSSVRPLQKVPFKDIWRNTKATQRGHWRVVLILG